jgi:Calcineurin-like phosphoesterase
MIDEVVNESEIQRYVTAMREQLADPQSKLQGAAVAAAQAIGAGDEDPQRAILSRMPDPANLKQSSGGDTPGMPFIARDPITSLLQSALDLRFREAGIVQERDVPPGSTAIVNEQVVREQPEKMGPDDDEHVTDIATLALSYIAKGSHPFNPKPALWEITSGDPLVIVVGDWGSGPARDVGRLMDTHIKQAGQRPVAVIHLGGVYQSGWPEEYDDHFWPHWPLPKGGLRAGVTSWSLNGNHDMYSGSGGYFDYLLADPTFGKQCCPDGKPTSFFRLRTPTWDLVGLDTAWHPNVLGHPGDPVGEVGDLDDPNATQAACVTTWATEAKQTGRALMLLSHHQLVSAFSPSIGEEIGGTLTLPTKLKDKLGSVLSAGCVRAWLWGHEHRCVGFEPLNLTGAINLAYPRCIGHGGMHMGPYTKDDLPPGVSFIERATETDEYGNPKGRCGFAVLDFAADGSIAVSYYDDHGDASPPPERFTLA